MSFEFACEACGAKLRIGDDQAGKTVKCPKCSAVVPAKAAEGAAPGESPFGERGPVPRSTDDVNPYASPATIPEGPFGGQAAAGTQAITPGIHLAMSQTRPWVLFLSFLGFIAGGFMALASFGLLISALFTQQFILLMPGLMYVPSAAFYLGCSYYLFLYSYRIGSFRQTNHVRDLESALIAQKSFWKLAGIMAVIMFALGLLMMLGFILLPMTMRGTNF